VLAKLAWVLGPGWETLTRQQVEARALELERTTNFVWAAWNSMRERHAPNAGAVLPLARPGRHGPRL